MISLFKSFSAVINESTLFLEARPTFVNALPPKVLFVLVLGGTRRSSEFNLNV